MLKESDFIRYNNFLSEELNTSIYQHVIENESKFVKSTQDYSISRFENSQGRVSKVAASYIISNFQSRFIDALSSKILKVCKHLQIDTSAIRKIEMEVTSHNHADYFRKHTDINGVGIKHRLLSYVYYFHAVPRKFNGGQLILYGKDRIEISPTNNSILFFHPSIPHEVLPVKCLSKKFHDGRFTINGWFSE